MKRNILKYIIISLYLIISSVVMYFYISLGLLLIGVFLLAFILIKYRNNYRSINLVLLLSCMFIFWSAIAGFYNIPPKVVKTSGNKISSAEILNSNTIEAPAQMPSPILAEETKESAVYITISGTKYHKENCRTLKDSKIKISKDEAIKKNLDACKICKP